MGLYVELLYLMGPQTHIPKYKLTLFRSTTHGPERIYQLHVEKLRKVPRHWHFMAHEHMGDGRHVGAPQWLNWKWSQIIGRFSDKSGVKFLPKDVVDPGLFELKGQ